LYLEFRLFAAEDDVDTDRDSSEGGGEEDPEQLSWSTPSLASLRIAFSFAAAISIMLQQDASSINLWENSRRSVFENLDRPP
jgi:hypothetical protein